MTRDYETTPVSDSLGLHGVIIGLASDLEGLRAGRISPADAHARAAIAKQMFNGVRLYLQAMKTIEAMAKPANGDEAAPAIDDRSSGR